MQKDWVIKLKGSLHKNFSFMYKIYYFFQKSINGPENKKKIAASVDYLKECKDKYNGETCFVIGNGPSLLATDLDKLKNEKCFASNKIYKIFDKTDWRPSFYCSSDLQLLQQSHSEMFSYPWDSSFVGVHLRLKYPEITNSSGLHYVLMYAEDFYPKLPSFSDNALYGIYDGLTVTYMMIQLAVHMGFKKIYLLGIDNNYSVQLNPDGTIERFSDAKDHFGDSNDYMSNIPVLFKTNLSFQSAKEYADAHGIKIYNATRGGKLEVFERVDFDSLFPPEDSENNAPKTDK